ncbi:hypothetical protein KJ678_00670, partial [Patescibacteria group bacterium]|nr:hypothetical protein [Patescibacteria group bacterium]
WSKYNEYNNAIASAKATTDATLNNLSNAYIKSPINGVITKLNYKEGENIILSPLSKVKDRKRVF